MPPQTLSATPIVIRAGLVPPFTPGVNAVPGRGNKLGATAA